MPKGQQEIVRPIVFVGLGSSGAKIVSRIKLHLDQSGDDFTRQFYRYLRVTSEETPESGVDPNIEPVIFAQGSPKTDDAISVFLTHTDAGVRERFQSWWHRDGEDKPWTPPSYSLKTGAGGVRSVGRLLLHFAQNRPANDIANKFRGIRASIEATRKELPEHEQANVAGPNSAFDCYVFGLLAGGTCSGTFMDLAYLIHEGMVQVNLFGAFLLGNICYDEMSGGRTGEQKPLKMEAQKQNTRYALAEMMLLSTKTGSDATKGEWIRRLGATEISPALLTRYPYHSIALVGSRNDDGLALRDFDEYLDFVAEYYARLFATEANARDIGRTVDEVAQDHMQLEIEYKSRPSLFERIGMLSVRAPTEKIRALIRRDLALKMGIDFFKNSDSKKVDELVNRFKATIRREEILAQLAPPDEEIVPQRFDPAPQNASDFADQVTRLKKDLDAFYGPWKERQSDAVRERLTAFAATATTAFDALLQATLVQGGAGDFSVGELEAALKSLREDLSTQIADLESRSNELGKQQEQLATALMDELEDRKSDFPRAGWFRLPGMRSWSGFDDLIEMLGRYRGIVRALAATSAARAALTPLIAELDAVGLARRILGKIAFDHSQQASDSSDRLFAETSQASSFRHEVLSSREDILLSFVDPIMETLVASESATPDLRTVASRSIAAGWRSESGAPLLDAFRELVAIVRQAPAIKEPAIALDKLPKLAERARALARGLEQSFKKRFDEMISPQLMQITVWEALRRYVQRVVDRERDLKASQVMSNLFRTYAERLRPFTRLAATVGADGFDKHEVRHYFICDEAAAIQCFDALGIESPETYLGRLLASTIGDNHVPLHQARSTGQELLLFTRRRGDMPLFYDGYESVRELLGANPPEEINERRRLYWTDRRFPEWVQRWHQQKPAPHALSK